MTQFIPVGTSEPLDFALKDDGEAFVGTGFTLAIEMAKKVSGVLTALESGELPTVAWLNQAAGMVRVSGVEVLTTGTYFVRFKVTDVATKVGYFPNGEKADMWRVVAVGNQ